MNIFENKTILITGGTGSWGNELVTQLLNFNPKEIRIYSRGEINQVGMERKFRNPKLKFIIGDIREYDQLLLATKDVDIIYHLAALKHIPVCESYPREAIRTNIYGTENLIRAAIHNKVPKVVDVSTDKAVAPHNLYGMTKAVGERLILNGNEIQSDTDFRIIRGGNALGSSGSVVPYMIDQIKRFNRIEITDERMTRYYITLTEAIQLLFEATDTEIRGGIFVMKMPACRIIDLAKVLINRFGNNETYITQIGVREGEKFNEVLVSQYEAPYAYEYKDKYYLIDFKNSHPNPVKFTEYNSGQYLMNLDEIEKLLKRGNFI